MELPRTGSTAISRELIDYYDGDTFLRKHSYYQEFLDAASDEQINYRLIVGLRNPLDDAVSQYFKYKTDHKVRFSKPEEREYMSRRHMERYRFIAENNADFPTYFKKFYRYPYDNATSTIDDRIDFLIRFENLQEDFSSMLKGIGASQIRPLPLANKTAERVHFLTYYADKIIPRAIWIFWPYMKKWGYDLPEAWTTYKKPVLSSVLFSCLAGIRKVYWRHIRKNDNAVGKIFRKFFLDYNQAK